MKFGITGAVDMFCGVAKGTLLRESKNLHKEPNQEPPDRLKAVPEPETRKNRRCK